MIPNNAWTLRITAAAGTKLAGPFSLGTINLPKYYLGSRFSLRTEFYDPKTFLTHAALLRQGFPHCAIFPTAASRRSLDRVSVPVCLIVLSNQILIVALVSHYLTNKLISRKLLSRRKNPFHSKAYGVLATVSSCCPPPKGKFLRVTHPSAT